MHDLSFIDIDDEPLCLHNVVQVSSCGGPVNEDGGGIDRGNVVRIVPKEVVIPCVDPHEGRVQDGYGEVVVHEGKVLTVF